MSASKSKLPILLASFGCLAAGLGFFKAANNNVKVAKADGDFKIDYDGFGITLGSYPSLISYEDSTWNEAPGEKQDLGDGKYEYEGEYYTRIYCIPSGGTLPGPQNYPSSAIWHKYCFFKWEEIEWKVVKEDATNGVTYFISTYILDTCRWQSGAYEPANDWENSTMRDFLNNEFLNKAFTDQEKVAIKEFTTNEDNTSKRDITDRVGLISKRELDQHQSLLNATPTGYAIGRGDYYWKFITDSSTYATYYLNSTDNTGGDTNLVDIAYKANTSQSITTNETRADCEIGVRPLIAIDNNYLLRKSTGGGGGGGSSVNVPLIIAIIFSVLGMGGVIAFLTLWHKGKLFKVGSTKAPIWVIASISISLVISIVGVSMLFGSTAGVGYGYSQTSPVGYWSSPEFTVDVASPDFGYSYFMGLDKDHRVFRYKADKWGEGGVKNFVLERVGGVGTWEIKGKKLIIYGASGWNYFSWEEETMTYYPVNGKGFNAGIMIMNEGSSDKASYVVGGYRWSHTTTVNPTGENVTNKEAGVK